MAKKLNMPVSVRNHGPRLPVRSRPRAPRPFAPVGFLVASGYRSYGFKRLLAKYPCFAMGIISLLYMVCISRI